jgi:2-amino-4-hydroxy-6-hydroxymethyldihydropteridine diphosphokinase
MAHRVYLGLGSNLGERADNIAMAISHLREKVAVDVVSSIYETEPVGYAEQPRFLNVVCVGITDLSPKALLAFVKDIEAQMGRKATFRYGPRPIDIDILFYDSLILESPALTIPHPRLHERAFVLVPLLELASQLRHPVLGKTIAEMATEVEGKEGVRRWPTESGLGT